MASIEPLRSERLEWATSGQSLVHSSFSSHCPSHSNSSKESSPRSVFSLSLHFAGISPCPAWTTRWLALSCFHYVWPSQIGFCHTWQKRLLSRSRTAYILQSVCYIQSRWLISNQFPALPLKIQRCTKRGCWERSPLFPFGCHSLHLASRVMDRKLSLAGYHSIAKLPTFPSKQNLRMRLIQQIYNDFYINNVKYLLVKTIKTKNNSK